MKYLVTGATGFLGGHVVDVLLGEGHDVVALVRTPGSAAAADLEAQGVELVEGDVTDRESMRPAFADVDGVFHLAAWYEIAPDDPARMERINVDGTRNVLELVDEFDVPKAVYTSTLAVFSDTEGNVVDERYRTDGPFLTEYDRTKWLAHYEVAEPMAADGVPVVTVLPGVVYGPGDTSDLGALWEEYLLGDLPAIPREVAFCWGHVEDVARAHYLAMERGDPGEEYIVAGEPYRLVEAMKLAERITGVDAPRTVPPVVFGLLAGVAALLGRVVTLPKNYRAESLRVLAGTTYLGDNAKAKRELGLEHRPFAEGLRETLTHEMAELGVSPPREPPATHDHG